MIIVHHLSDSRSQKVVWLLEELGVPHTIVPYQRHPELRIGPPALKAVHPIGKAPAIEAEGRVIVESGAIIDYILRRHGDGALMPDPASSDLLTYLEWCYFAVSIGTNPIMMKVYANAYGLQETRLAASADTEMAAVLNYMESSLEGRTWLLGNLFTAADIQMSFVGELAKSLGSINAYPNTRAWLVRCAQRPAYQRSLAGGVSYRFSVNE